MAYNVCAMEPRIQYAQTNDGVSIAFWTLGVDEARWPYAASTSPCGCTR
jgi:hypothetical protein